MKSIYPSFRFFSGITLLTLITSCNQDASIHLTEIVNPDMLPPSEVFVYQNFDGSGIDFIISPKHLSTHTTQRIKNNETDSSTDHFVTEQTLFELMTFYPDATESVNTQLLFQVGEDGLLYISHLSEDGEPFATMIYREEELLEVKMFEVNSASLIPGGTLFKVSTGLKTFYNCVNNEYQRIKGIIEGDMINDITCKVLFFFCKPLMVMTAVEECR